MAVFTSSIQLDHLFEVARDLRIESQVLNALRHGVAVASVGAVMTGSLEAKGISPGIIPERPKMGGLIKAAAEQASAVLARKARPKASIAE